YYQALMEGQKRRGHVDENISAWVLYFLERLHILIQKLDAKYDLFKSKGGYLNPRQKELIAYLKEHQPLKLSDMAGAFKEVSIHTLKKDLQYMVKEQMVRRLGRGKGSVYVLDEEEAGD
ncbi:MAG TPA: DeoR family transcriptional regulator, partial [Phaeodactylibacter sp.]|nr:DeoR family transcriptional regulator [Phaeodactylibacter sp.]